MVKNFILLILFFSFIGLANAGQNSNLLNPSQVKVNQVFWVIKLDNGSSSVDNLTESYPESTVLQKVFFMNPTPDEIINVRVVNLTNARLFVDRGINITMLRLTNGFVHGMNGATIELLAPNLQTARLNEQMPITIQGGRLVQTRANAPNITINGTTTTGNQIEANNRVTLEHDTVTTTTVTATQATLHSGTASNSTITASNLEVINESAHNLSLVGDNANIDGSYVVNANMMLTGNLTSVCSDLVDSEISSDSMVTVQNGTLNHVNNAAGHEFILINSNAVSSQFVSTTGVRFIRSISTDNIFSEKNIHSTNY